VNNAGGDPLREFHTMTIEENLRTPMSPLPEPPPKGGSAVQAGRQSPRPSATNTW